MARIPFPTHVAVILSLVAGTPLIIGSGWLTLSAILARATPAPQPAADPADAPPIDALVTESKDLVAEYDENEIRADDLYRGLRITIRGRVESFGKDIRSQAYVMLAGQRHNRVQCFFSGRHADRLARLSAGDTITVIGTCRGRAVISVIMNDCRVTESVTGTR